MNCNSRWVTQSVTFSSDHCQAATINSNVTLNLINFKKPESMARVKTIGAVKIIACVIYALLA